MDKYKFLVVFGIVLMSLFMISAIMATPTDDKIDKVKDNDYIKSLRKNDTIRESNGNLIFDKKYKSFNSSEKRIKIEDDEYKTIIEFDLLTPYENKITSDMPIARIQLIDWDKRSEVFEIIETYDMNSNYDVSNNVYEYKYATNYIEEECNDLQEYSKDITNETLFCENVTKKNWTVFSDLKDLPHKDIEVGIFTDTQPGERKEWLPTVEGFVLFELADWEFIGMSSYTDIAGDYSVEGIRKFAFNGDYLYTSSLSDYTISIFNVSNKSEMAQMASFTNSAFLNGISDMEIQNDYLYVSAATLDRISIFNVSNKSEIALTSFYDNDTGNYSIDGIKNFDVDNDYLYTSSETDDVISIFDISNKSEVIPISSYYDIDGEYSVEQVADIEVDGNYLYVSSLADNYLSIFDISNKSEIIPISSYYNTSGEGSTRNLNEIQIDGDYLYTYSNTDAQFTIYNASNKSEIIPISSYYDVDGNYSIHVGNFNVDENYLVTASSADDYVSLMDITNKSEIIPLYSYYDIDGEYSVEGIYDVIIKDGFIYTSSSIDDVVSVMKAPGTAEINPPTYSNNQTSYPASGESITFSILWDDDFALHPNGQYIFSTNNTGVWINDSAINFTSTPSWANVTKTLNDTSNLSIGYRWYATDNAGNITSTEIFTVTTVEVEAIITDPTTASPESVSTGNNISINFNLQENGVNITSGVTMENVAIGGSYAELISSLSAEVSPYGIFYEDFEDDWDIGTSYYSAGPGNINQIGNFNNADNNANDYYWDRVSYTGRIYDGYSLVLDDWDAGTENSTDGIWYNFDASTACDGSECEDINVNWWWMEVAIDAGDYCWVTEQIGVGTPTTLKEMIQPQDTYTQESVNLSSGALSSDNVSIRIMCDLDSLIDNFYMDNFNITGYAKTSANEFGYIDGVGWQVNVTVPDFSDGLKDLFLNATYLGLTFNDTQTEAIDYGGGGEDTTSPTWSLNQTNNTKVGLSTMFSILWDDEIALHPSGQYIFSTNNTGAWVNDSAINFTSTPQWANITKTLNDTAGVNIGYRWFTTDNAGNINNTEIFTLTTIVSDTCTYTSGDWVVNCSDNCAITSPVDVGGNDIFITGTGTFSTTEDISNYSLLHIEGTNASNICRVTCSGGGCFKN